MKKKIVWVSTFYPCGFYTISKHSWNWLLIFHSQEVKTEGICKDKQYRNSKLQLYTIVNIISVIHCFKFYGKLSLRITGNTQIKTVPCSHLLGKPQWECYGQD